MKRNFVWVASDSPRIHLDFQLISHTMMAECEQNKQGLFHMVQITAWHQGREPLNCSTVRYQIWFQTCKVTLSLLAVKYLCREKIPLSPSNSGWNSIRSVSGLKLQTLKHCIALAEHEDLWQEFIFYQCLVLNQMEHLQHHRTLCELESQYINVQTAVNAKQLQLVSLWTVSKWQKEFIY